MAKSISVAVGDKETIAAGRARTSTSPFAPSTMANGSLEGATGTVLGAVSSVAVVTTPFVETGAEPIVDPLVAVPHAAIARVRTVRAATVLQMWFLKETSSGVRRMKG